MWLILLWTCSNKGIFCHKDADNMDGTLVADNHFVIFTTILILNSYANTKRTLAHKYQGFIPGVPNFEAILHRLHNVENNHCEWSLLPERSYDTGKLALVLLEEDLA